MLNWVHLLAALAAARSSAAPHHQHGDGDLLWHKATSDRLGCESSLAVTPEDGSLFVLTGTSLTKLAGETGATLWSQAGLLARFPESSTPSLSVPLGTVLVPGDEALVAVSAASGEIVWNLSSTPGSTFTSSASFSSDGRTAFVGCGWATDCEAITAVDVTTGAQKWRFAPHNVSTSRTHTVWAKIIITRGLVIVGDFGGHLFALNETTGAAVWRFDERIDPTKQHLNEMWASVALLPGGMELIATSNLGYIRKLEVATGREVVVSGGGGPSGGSWPIPPKQRRRTTGHQDHRPAVAIADPIIFSSPVVDSAGDFYVAAENWCVYGFDGATGAEKWSNCQFCSWGTAGLLLREDGVLVYGADLPVSSSPSSLSQCPPYVVGCDPPSADKAGHLIGLNSTDGAMLWSTRIPGFHTFVCNEQIPNILPDGTVVITGGTYGGVSAFASAAKLATEAPWPKFGGDYALSGAQRACA